MEKASVWTMVGICVVQLSCSPPSSKPIWINEGLNLSHEEGQRLTALAQKGDVEACETLSNYYSFVALDDEEAIRWLLKALSHDPQNPRLKHNLRMLREGVEK